MPTPRHRRSTVKPDRVRALELLDGCDAEGCTEAILHAHGFATADIAELVRAGFASVTAERGLAGSRKMEVARARITGTGSGCSARLGTKMPAPSGIDATLKLEAVYLSAPIPRNLAVLTAMGAIFDKVYFPGVYLPKEGFDVRELDKEITRLKALPQDYDRQLLLGILDLTKHAKTLAGFCEFTADPDDVFGTKSEPPQQLVRAIFEAIHGPPREGFTPMFDSGHSKGLPGGDEAVHYPGNHHYLARAIIHSGKTGIPLLNDIPGLKLPGILEAAPQDDAKLLAGILAVECTRVALPPTPLLRPEDIMEFREANAHLLRGFRRSMLRYAADLNSKIKDITPEEFETKTKFFIETQIVPSMDELNATMNDPARPWHKRAIDALKIIPQVGGAFLAGGGAAALTKAITATAAQFFVEVAAKGDKKEALKRSGLTYLLRLQQFHDRS